MSVVWPFRLSVRILLEIFSLLHDLLEYFFVPFRRIAVLVQKDGKFHVIVNYKALVLTIKHTIYTGNGLYECMLLQRFIDVHAMRLKPDSEMAMRDAMDSVTGTYFTPTVGEADLRRVVIRESIIRPLATNLKKYRGGSVIWAADSRDCASFVPEGAPIPGFDVEEDFTRIRVGSHKIACLLKLSEEFALDADFALLFLCLYSLFVAVGI